MRRGKGADTNEAQRWHEEGEGNAASRVARGAHYRRDERAADDGHHQQRGAHLMAI